VPGKIAGSLEGEISAEPEWLSEQVSVLAEDRVIFPLITVQNKSRGGAETQREYQERPKTKEVTSHFVSEFPNF